MCERGRHDAGRDGQVGKVEHDPWRGEEVVHRAEQEPIDQVRDRAPDEESGHPRRRPATRGEP
jgi:hypothetical protein